MDQNDQVCLELGLGLGLTQYSSKRDNSRKNKRLFFFDLSIPLHEIGAGSSSNLKVVDGEDYEVQGSKNSFSNCSKEDDDSNCSKDFSRKKLRLTRDQIILLEGSFKQHTTLNMAQKQALAERLNLKPRQVEVWFQNRRARTKLKQTEVDCEFLKKNCERLTEENRRLKKELLELRSSLKIEQPQPPPAARPLFFLQNINSVASREKHGIGRGGGEKQEAAAGATAVMEVVHEP